MQSIDSYNFNGKRTLVRVDFNVPLNKELHITDDTRMRAALPTIKKILDDGGIAILMSHLGRPKEKEPEFSLQHLVKHLEKLTQAKVHFAEDCVGDVALAVVDEAINGEIVLLNNTRYHKAEKEGDPEFAKALAEMGDAYVNDAFGTAHRAHASTTVVAQFFPNDRMFGYLMQKEVDSLQKALNSADKPFTAIIGGAKVSDKVSVIENLLPKADHILIGGAMAYTFIAAQGGKVGKSLIEADKFDLAKSLLEKAKAANTQMHFPVDSLVAEEFVADAEASASDSDKIGDDLMGLDIGPKAAQEYAAIVGQSKILVWNGPMGVFEFAQFQQGTKKVAEAVAKATQENHAFSLVGGGDSVAAINTFKLADQVSFVSTGGGAMLEYLEGKHLPGIAAIHD